MRIEVLLATLVETILMANSKFLRFWFSNGCSVYLKVYLKGAFLYEISTLCLLPREWQTPGLSVTLIQLSHPINNLSQAHCVKQKQITKWKLQVIVERHEKGGGNRNTHKDNTFWKWGTEIKRKRKLDRKFPMRQDL